MTLARKLTLGAGALLIALGAVAPLLNANRFRGQIQSALEAALSRRVTIGKVRFNVFTGPGFTVEDVLIGEAPGMGIEPFAHVDSLVARIRVASLWTGHLAFSNLNLVDASVNFVKRDSGPWNIQALLNQARLTEAGAHAEMPEIQITDGRLNFKLGDTKSVFYLSNAGLDVYSQQNGELVIRFSGEPARTDHAAQGLGRLVARGTLRSRPNAEDDLNMSVQLERTALPEIARLFGVTDIGVRGFTASNLKLDGPLSRVKLSGALRIEDIHRWDLMPNKGEGWTLNYAGLLNVPGQQVNIETRSTDPQGSPIEGTFAATDYLTSPQWRAVFRFHDLPAASLLETARHMGAQLPAGATVDGKLNGELAYTQPAGMSGRLLLNSATFKFPQGGVTEFASAPVAIANSTVQFGPVDIQFDDEQAAQLEASYAFDTGALSLGLETKSLGIVRTKDLMARLTGAAPPVLLERCRQGLWKGSIRFARSGDGPGLWTGAFDLQNAQIDLPGFAVPVRLAAASVECQNQLVLLNRMRGRLAEIAFEGDYRYYLAPDHPDRIRISIPELQLADLEQALLPTLRRHQGSLARALRLEKMPVPEWLVSRNLEGLIQLKHVKAGDIEIGSVKTRLEWFGATASLLGIESKLENMQGSGRIAVNLSGAAPQYRLVGQLKGIDFRGGTLDVDGAVDTYGLGASLALNAKSDGTFRGDALTLNQETELDEVSGDYRAEGSSTGPRLSLSKLQVTQGQEVLHGQGATQPDGKLVLDLTGPVRKQIRLTNQ